MTGLDNLKRGCINCKWCDLETGRCLHPDGGNNTAMTDWCGRWESEKSE